MAPSPSFHALLDGLNPAQRAAVEHGRAPLLVVAGAGSGKTATLAARAARLVAQGTDPQRLLLLTFSRRAADEMARRAGTLLARQHGRPPEAGPAPALPWAGTFHAIGARLLRQWAAPLGLANGFSVVDRADAEDLLALEREALGLATQRRRFPLKGSCLAIYSRAINTEQPLAQVLAEQFPWCQPWEGELRRLFAAYEAAKRRQQLLDLDDLLLAWAEALADPGIAQAMGGRFDHVLVDEYQDTNRLQARILQRLKPDGEGLTVVGDDAQAIYRFRGAELRNLLDFPATFGPATRVLALEQNYRSTPALLAASNALMAQAGERVAKTLWSAGPDGPRPLLVTVADEAAQAAWVADSVLRQRESGLALRRQAVLFRTAPHSLALELELVRRDIPFVKYGGLQFMQAAHVKDLLALLRWTLNPRHALAGTRCAMQVPGIGPARARRLVEAVAASDDPAAAIAGFRPPPAAAADWAGLRDTWLALHAPGGGGDAAWPQAIDRALDWLLPQLPRLHADAPARAADLRQLARLARGWASRERFLAELTLDPPQAVGREAGAPHRDDDWLVLSTIHSAKGQEWSAVTVLNVVDGCLPADMATGSAAEIDEERRLLYVAMTRAQRHLQLMLPQRFHVTQQSAWGDRHVHALPSRFLTPELVALCDRLTAGEAGAVADDAPGVPRRPGAAPPAPGNAAAAATAEPAHPRPTPLLERLAGRWD
jgi:DNA helicase II / ATP-dependent DNA helicase PcrA